MYDCAAGLERRGDIEVKPAAERQTDFAADTGADTDLHRLGIGDNTKGGIFEPGLDHGP